MKYINANRLKNEIKRQITESKNRQTNLEKIGQESAGIVESQIRAILKSLLSSIDFLQQEHPEVDLKEDVKSWFFNEISSKINVEHTMYYYFQECARRYAKWGAEHRGSSETPKDLESYAQKVEDYYDVGEERGYLCVHRGEVKDAVIAGAKWQAEQDQETIELAEDHAYLAGAVNEREKIMKEAVEGEVMKSNKYTFIRYQSVNEIEGKRTYPGDKVKLIIVKEDTK